AIRHSKTLRYDGLLDNQGKLSLPRFGAQIPPQIFDYLFLRLFAISRFQEQVGKNLASSAEFYSAVSPSCTRRSIGPINVFESLAGWQSATLRYGRVKLCVTWTTRQPAQASFATVRRSNTSTDIRLFV